MCFQISLLLVSYNLALWGGVGPLPSHGVILLSLVSPPFLVYLFFQVICETPSQVSDIILECGFDCIQFAEKIGSWASLQPQAMCPLLLRCVASRLSLGLLITCLSAWQG